MFGEDDGGVCVSGKSCSALMPAMTMRSNFVAPLPEEFMESERARGPQQELSYLNLDDDKLPDYQSEESSFCLPNPLQLQEKFGSIVQQYHMDGVTEEEEGEGDDLSDSNSMHHADSGGGDVASNGDDDSPSKQTDASPEAAAEGTSSAGNLRSSASGAGVARAGRNAPRSFQNTPEYIQGGAGGNSTNAVAANVHGAASGHVHMLLRAGARGAGGLSLIHI